MSQTTVWISPGARAFSCLCETCLESARASGALFFDAMQQASVRGSVAEGATTTVVRCSAGHEIILRRTSRPAALDRPDGRQLQLA
ncbi:MAG: hypothetical protein F2663_10075 [Actinobacteria bacterium]|nr:hypothetical protein [Actinomycetota bacterium]